MKEFLSRLFLTIGIIGYLLMFLLADKVEIITKYLFLGCAIPLILYLLAMFTNWLFVEPFKREK